MAAMPSIRMVFASSARLLLAEGKDRWIDGTAGRRDKRGMMRHAGLVIGLSLLLGGAAGADEGMWTFDNFPKPKVKAAYGFSASDEWLRHVMRSAVRLGGCSASFVSPEGLVATNHHCTASCVQQLSTRERDFMASGFVAAAASDEVRCPELDALQLTEIRDVTARVKEATKGLSGAKYQEARKAVQAALEKECQSGDTVQCQVVNLYHGGIYDLYRYRRFADVRLVFAPEKSMAFFGGDPDNFNFPRYDLDISFVRVYEGGKPARIEDYLRFSPRGARDGDLTFVAGHPGGTDRQLTVAQLEYQRDVALPQAVLTLAELRGLLTEFSRRSPEARRTAENSLFGVENSLKALRGEFAALRDSKVFAAKVAAEQSLRKRIKSRDEQAAFDDIARAETRMRELYKPLMIERLNGGRLFGIARTLLRASAERPLANEKRLEEYRDAALPVLQQRLFSPAPIYDDVERLMLTFALTKLREELGVDHPYVRKLLGKESPEEMAARVLKGTGLRDVATRKRLWDGGAAAVDAATGSDPLLAAVKLIDPDSRAIRKTWETEVDAVVRKNTELVARARFEVEGTKTYPDATGTLRLSYGTVKGWPENGQQVNPVTTLAGLYDRATGRPPFALPERWIAAKGQLDLNTPFNFATTHDIIGGNSGSPVISREGEFVGIIFDGNIHSLGGNFFYDPVLNRAVALEAPAVREALAKIYGARRLLEELGR
jgi:hypothetical protein